MEQNIFMCIDLKSFFASVECADRGLDPFTVNLVVSDPSRGNGAICLAITPAMKALGIRNRCRIFEIPPGVQYITAMPRMKRYMEVSAQVYGVYLRYISRRISTFTPSTNASSTQRRTSPCTILLRSSSRRP